MAGCRRRPPIIIECVVKEIMPKVRYERPGYPDPDVLDLAPAAKFPSTFSTDWCGEYEGARA